MALSSQVLILLLEFALLMGLGFAFMRLLAWHSMFEDKRAEWLQACRNSARELRILRKQLQKTDADLDKLPMTPRLRRCLSVISWAGMVFRVSKAARS